MGSSLVIATGGLDTEEGNPNVEPSAVLQGYTIYGFDGELQNGTMPVQTFSKKDQLPGTNVPVPLGYQNGTGTISAVSLSSRTGATADVGHILWNYTGWRDGYLKTGTMPNKGSNGGSIGANGTFTVPVGWYNGSGKVTQSLSTQSATTVTPGTSNKTVIAASKWSTGNQIVAGDSKLAAGNIKKGISIFGVTGSYIAYGPTILNRAYLRGSDSDIDVVEAELIGVVNGNDPNNLRYKECSIAFGFSPEKYSKLFLGGYIHSTGRGISMQLGITFRDETYATWVKNDYQGHTPREWYRKNINATDGAWVEFTSTYPNGFYFKGALQSNGWTEGKRVYCCVGTSWGRTNTSLVPDSGVWYVALGA